MPSPLLPSAASRRRITRCRCTVSEISRRRTSSAALKAMMTRILDYPSPLPMQRARCPVRLRLSSSCPALMIVPTRLPQASARAHAQRTHPLDYLLTATRRRSRGPSIVASAFTLCLWSRHCQSPCRRAAIPAVRVLAYVLPRHRRPCTTTRKGCSPLLGECIENGRGMNGLGKTYDYPTRPPSILNAHRA